MSYYLGCRGIVFLHLISIEINANSTRVLPILTASKLLLLLFYFASTQLLIGSNFALQWHVFSVDQNSIL